MILSLFWKDLRLNVPVFLAAVLLCVAAYMGAFALSFAMTNGSFPLASTIFAGNYICQWLCVLACALLGGNAFASEHEDLSIRFLMALPVRPRDVLFAKGVVALLALECLWIVNAAVVHATAGIAGLSYRHALPGAAGMPTISAISLMVFGVSWLWSVVMTRPVVAAVSGLLSCGLLYLALYAVARYLPSGVWSSQLAHPSLFAALLGCAGFVAGGRLFLARTRTAKTGQDRLVFMRIAANRPLPDSLDRAGRGTPPRRLAALLWKDWRLMRGILLAGGALVALPYVFAVVGAPDSDEWPVSFARASTQSLWLCCVVLAVWGGYLTAAERQTQTVRFVEALPVSKLRIAGSRLVAALLPSLLVLGVDCAVAVASHQAVFQPSPMDESGTGFFRMTWPLLLWQQTSLLFALPVIAAPLVCFGVAWLASARLAKPFLGCVLGSISTGVIVVVWVTGSSLVEEVLPPFQAALAFAGAACVVSAACITVGCLSMARRDTP